ncbi:MAG: PQQ-like beta-propeller repeat protein [Myxococcales bacterium]|nr:PQQ-like beta-propeller repeat protein [Myxococcales bacterium]MDH3482835.1 PQQ-like beta-propeller repeat protein [Myxococcales bacterium]
MVAPLDESVSHAQKRTNSGVPRLLLGSELDVEVPALAELTAATAALAIGAKRKVLLPLATCAIEYALVRRGDSVLVSCYGTASAPVVYQLDRTVPLRLLLHTCAQAMLETARQELDPTARQIAIRVAERALATKLAPDPIGPIAAVNQRGGELDAPPSEVPLAFGYEAAIYPSSSASQSRSVRADVHALLFEGHLWAFVRGRRLSLVQGPLMLAAHRMVVAVRTLVDSWDSAQPTHVRLRAGGFQIAMRKSSHQLVSVELHSEGRGDLTATSLSIAEAALPILKLASDLLRSLVASDRGQSRNLRVRALRQEVRALRREIRARRNADSFVNLDPDRLRIHNEVESGPTAKAERLPSLQFEERWRICLEGLDANSVFMCGDRLVIATQNHVVAISRDDGQVLWARPGQASTTLMAGSVLIRLSPDGEVELCNVEDGAAYCSTHITPRIGGPPSGLMAGGGSIPPVAVITEGSDRLVALDIRTGEPRWRFASRTGGEFRMTKIGRVLLVTCGEEAIHAIDLATGEDVWRFAERGCFQFKPLVRDETVVAAAVRGRREGALYAIDLYSGQPRWQRELQGPPTSDPSGAASVVLVSTAGEQATLTAHSLDQGEPLWDVKDPGLGIGGAGMTIDGTWIVNAPFGQLSAFDVHTGHVQWSTNLADALADEIPRRLEPVLRGGALFVPASSVHVVRPADGTRLSASLPCDLVPDLMRVDERGWVYVAEESGYLAGYAPKPMLTLVRGG